MAGATAETPKPNNDIRDFEAGIGAAARSASETPETPGTR